MYKNQNSGDMPPEEFRRLGHQLIDWIADYLKDIEKYPVLPDIAPGEIKKQVSQTPPEKGEPLENVFKDIDKIIMPGMTHWNHPDFMAYFNSTSSGPGILAELLSAAFNVNGMLWKTCPSSTELEEMMLNWFRQMLDFPEDFWGIIYDTASVSSMHAIAAAREQVKLEIRKKGMAGRDDIPRIRLYCSEHAHSSIDKAAITLGIGMEGIHKIPVDNEFRMKPAKLKEAIDEDKRNGCLPFCVIATVGTTSTTSIDPVDEIAEICNKENIWLHVDAAYAGVTAIIPGMRYIFKGIEKADSIVVNPHKWMFTPIDLSAFYTRKPEVLKQAFSLVAEYLKTSEDTSVENYMDYGIQLGRRFRSLKLWFIIRYFGVEGIRSRIKEHMRLAENFADWIDRHSNFERMAPTPFATVCFRAKPVGMKEEELNDFNEKLLNSINSTGKLFLSHTKLNDKFVIRISIGSIRVEQRHVEEAKKLIEEKLNLFIKNQG